MLTGDEKEFTGDEVHGILNIKGIWVLIMHRALYSSPVTVKKEGRLECSVWSYRRGIKDVFISCKPKLL